MHERRPLLLEALNAIYEDRRRAVVRARGNERKAEALRHVRETDRRAEALRHVPEVLAR